MQAVGGWDYCARLTSVQMLILWVHTKSCLEVIPIYTMIPRELGRGEGEGMVFLCIDAMELENTHFSDLIFADLLSKFTLSLQNGVKWRCQEH